MAKQVLLQVQERDVTLTLWTNGSAAVEWSGGAERYECPGQLALRWIPSTEPIAKDVMGAIRSAREELRRRETEEAEEEELLQ